MTSEIRANTLKNRVGLGTVSFTNTGPIVSGIITANSFSGTGDLDVDGHTNLDNVSIAGVTTANVLNFGDSNGSTTNIAKFGASGDLVIYHNGNHSKVIDVGTGNLYLESDVGSIFLRVSDNEQGVTINQDGDVQLYHNNNLKLSTTSSGISVNGNIAATGNLTPGGTLHLTDAIEHTDDSNTKIRFPADDTVTIETAGAERLRIDSSGNINLGSGATIAGLRYLDVQNSSSAANNHGSVLRLITSNAAGNSTTSVDMVKYKDGNFYINNNETSGSTNFNTGGSTRLTIASGGDMGLGTNSPNSYSNQRVFTINGTSLGRLDLEVGGTLKGSVWGDSGGLGLDAGGNSIEMYTGSAQRVFINTSGQMGIGQNFTPSRHLDIKDSTGANRIVNIRGTGTSGAFLAFLDANTTDDSKCRVGSVGGNNMGLRADAHYFQNGTGTDRMVITSDGYVHLGNTGHGTNKVGGQAVTGEDFDPYFKLYASTSNHWLMHLRSDTATGSNGIFMRAGNNSNNYSMYITARDEHTPHFVVRGDGKVGINSTTPFQALDVRGSINGGSINQPFQRFHDSHGNQRVTKHYFRCTKGGTSIYDILTVDLNTNFHQALIILYYGARIQNGWDSTTFPVHKIIGVNRFNGGNIGFTKNTVVQDSTVSTHANIDVVATSSTQYRIRLTYSGTAGGSSFCCGSVEIIGVGSGTDGAFYSLAHSHGLVA